MGSLEDRMRELLDKQAITEQIYNYGRCMDRLDRDLGKAVFHPEAVADYGAQMFQGTGWAFVDWIMEAHLQFTTHTHEFSNILIAVDGDRAQSETYGDVTLRRRDADGTLHDIRNLGRYIDRWERRDDAWRIIHRQYVHEFDQTGPALPGQFATMGRRDTTDPSYFPAPA
jgi:hypothetical protein